MFNYAIDDITILAILDKRRTCANGDYPIRIRVNWRKNKKYYSTGKTCTIEIWDRLPAAKSKELVKIRSEIQTSFSIIGAHVKELHEKDSFNAGVIRLRRIIISSTQSNTPMMKNCIISERNGFSNSLIKK